MSKHPLFTAGAFAAFALIQTLATAGQGAHIVEKLTLENGLRAVVRHEPGARTVAISVFVGAGVAEDGNKPGIGALTSRAIFGSNLNQSREDVLHSIYEVGGNLEVEWNPDYTLYTCVTSSERMEDALYVICQAFKGAQFDTESVETARSDLLADLDRLNTDTYHAAYAAFRQRAYRQSLYREAFRGSPASIRRITPLEVKRFHQKYFVPGNIVFSIVGNIKGLRVRRALENYLGDQRGGLTSANHAGPPEMLMESGVISRFLPTNTATIIVGFNGPGLRHVDYPAFSLLATIIGGGKSSRLWRAMRDSAGIGYVVRAQAAPLKLDGHLILHLDYDPYREGIRGQRLEAETAGEMMIATARSLIENPATEKELDRAKTYTLGSYALAHQRPRDRAFYLGWYESIGLGHEHDSELPAKTAAVSLEEINAAAKKYLTKQILVTMKPSARPGPGRANRCRMESSGCSEGFLIQAL